MHLPCPREKVKQRGLDIGQILALGSHRRTQLFLLLNLGERPLYLEFLELMLPGAVSERSGSKDRDQPLTFDIVIRQPLTC